MSSYRSYTPWKSSLPTSYKSGAGSAYSSRDDNSSTRYSSLAPPSTYRPSFSGGTYRVKREPPVTPVTPYVSRYAAVSSTRADAGDAATKAIAAKRYTSSATSSLAKYGSSREPSPAAIERTNRMKSREPSPVTVRTLRGKSRDPSPVTDTKCKLGYGGVSSYRMSSAKATPTATYTPRYSSAATTTTTRSSSSNTAMPDKSISYLTASDMRARSVSRARETARRSSEKELQEAPVSSRECGKLSPTPKQQQAQQQQPQQQSQQQSQQQQQQTQSSEESATDSDSSEEEFVSVSVVTRATSPTPPGNNTLSTVQRTRRIDIAKTIEKTIQRSSKRPQMLEKEIQSDRLDDSTRYSRFGSLATTYSSPHRESRYTSLRYSASPLSSTSKSSTSETRRDDSSRTERSTQLPVSSSKLSPPKVLRINSRQASVENLSSGSNAQKPPAAPKAESPTKSCASGVTKLPNKDFRKSALNVGPTDRPRKSRTPSSGTDSDGVQPVQHESVNGGTHERSPSAGSEVSNASAASTSKRAAADSKLRQRGHAAKSSNAAGATSPLRRHNSSGNLRSNSHKLCAPHTSAATSASASTSSSANSSSTVSSSSSGAESSGEKKKTGKKAAKKKTSQHAHNRATATAAVDSVAATGDANDLSPKYLTAAENSRATAAQPPAASTKLLTAAAAESSPPEQTKQRLQKLSSVSNFFAARQCDTNSEPIFLESSDSSGDVDALPLASLSLTDDFETKTSPAKSTTATTTITTTTTTATSTTNNSTNYTNNTSSDVPSTTQQPYTNPASSENTSVAQYPPRNTSESTTSTSGRRAKCYTKSSSSQDTNEVTATHSQMPSELQTESLASYTVNTTRTTSTEPEEPSWWQDTSRQIDTASALDFNHKDEMRFKLRHIDSGETAWWLRNDEDDTLADDNLKTLNLEEDGSEATDAAQSLTTQSDSGGGPTRGQRPEIKRSWWTSDIDEAEEGRNESDNEQIDTNYGRSRSADPNMNGNGSPSWTTKAQIARSRLTPEQQWWDEEEEEMEMEPPTVNEKSAATQNGTALLTIRRVQSGQRAWWLDEEQNEAEPTVEATITLPVQSKPVERSSSSSKHSAGESKHSWLSAPSQKLFNVQRVQSGEQAWWQQDAQEEEVQLSKPQVKRSDSGEQPWWLQSDEADQAAKPRVEVLQNGYDAEVQQFSHYQALPQQFPSCSNSQTELSNSFNFAYAERPPPLGQCASPVGLEEAAANHCKSPYNHIPMSKVHVNSQEQQQQQLARQYSMQPTTQQQQQQQQQQPLYSARDHFNGGGRQQAALPGGKLFISRHQNIDELLGGSCRPLSPLFYDGGSFSTPPSNRNIFLDLEEITPDQVRIHDSTAQMPVIRRVEQSDEWENYAASAATPTPAANAVPRFEQRTIDDAAIQVYKDGDYGAYLDLESSLAEQSEEIEGLNTNRKNSLVVRTQLSVRVHAIIEKLLSAEGGDLRRALFSLKQVFQEDKDLVHSFVALGGLNCLVRVGNGADQNYQNYILRALGQVMLYVDGMNGVMKHEPTMQWLYSLIASNYRSVVKTALKLLLVFVEYAETNCYVLVNAIHSVDKAQGTLPWSNIMRLLKDYDNADAELVIYATSLINKTLAGLNDQDSFYDESDLLEQQGMDSVIQRYMSKPGTDLDLLDQLQLYEAVLKFEDGESNGFCLPENSLRKTQRHRQSTDTAERRKSRRHSTGTNATPINKVLPSPKRLTPTHGVLDEDSSGSTNSTEFSGGLFQEKKGRDAAGVTPGLRRRRERAERHKSFLKEQQEAAANGIFAALEKREELGQIVTAIPATIKSGDSPPESLVLTNETISNHTTSGINYTNITANATNNITTNNHNTTTNSATTTNNNNINNSQNNINQSNNLLSPTKQLLGSNTISIINNSFDKAHYNNINSNNSNKLQCTTPEFLTKKNLLIDATVINGIMKNIQRGGDAENREQNGQFAYKKYENDANRLNNYYSQLSSPKNNHINQMPHQNSVPDDTFNPTPATPQTPLTAMLSPRKTLNGFDFTQTSTPTSTPTSLPTPASTQFSETELSQSIASPLSPPPECAVELLNQPVERICTPKHTATNSTAAPPPPPPPPPPPDLLGYYSPMPCRVPYSAPLSVQDPPPTDSLLHITESDNEEKKLLLQLKRDHTVKDLTQKLSNMPMSPTHEDKQHNRIVGDMSGLISKAKEGLAKSKSKGEMSRSSSVDQEIKKCEPKKSENELHWEELVRNMSRPLNLCDLDFTDLNSDDEKDMLAPRGLSVGVPPPPPPFGGVPPPMMPAHMATMSGLVPPPMFSYSGYASLNNSVNSSLNGSINGDISNTNTIKKNKKTVKLFWKEVREDMIPVVVGKTIWDELPALNVDTQKLEHLFESRAKDLMTKKQQELNKTKEVIVLDHKRSNAINIAITKLPPPRAIKAAILKMDATVVTREGIDKLLNMLPTDEERGKIQEAQMASPELPLGSAEQFLLTLASISELAARLKLWAFRLDFDNSEKEIADPLMDLKQGIEILRNNRTFKCILSTLLSVGIFLNGAPVKGFQIEYLSKVPEVKDTVHKHSLLHHLCHMVMETSADTTDLYSEIGPITRASKADFADLAHNLNQLESECKASWDRLKLMAKHDCPPQLKQKLVDFLADCAERIIILQIVHRRVINRYRKFLLWLGVPQHSVAESKPNDFCRILSEFALEYRTTRERVQQQLEKKANHRERNKTRGKMIIDMAKFQTKEDRADAQLKELLGTPSPDTIDGTLTWRRRRAEQLRSPIARQSEENFTDGDDEILESLVKTATKAPGTRTTPRERKRTRHADRKSLRRTLKNGLTEEEKQHVSALIKTY